MPVLFLRLKAQRQTLARTMVNLNLSSNSITHSVTAGDSHFRVVNQGSGRAIRQGYLQ